jgi:serine acetyltransferase/thymidylate kinase
VRRRRNGLARWRQPSGLLIACLGPDGSGKSSVIRALHERPMVPFHQVHTMELRPRLMRPGPVKGPGRALAPRGTFGTAAKLLMFLADYWLGYWWKIRPKLVRSTLVVSDRYFDDVLVDPQRYRMHRPRAFTRMLLRWIPRPELWLVFDLPSEVLRARQADIATEEAIRLRAEYRRVLRAHENVVFLDASAPLEKVVAQAERAITTQLAQRTASQLGLPQETVQNPATANLLLFFCRRNVPLLSRLVKVVYNSDIQCRLPPDVHLPYPYGIVIHPHAVIGHRVTVMQQATIGDKNRHENVAPIIGDDVYVGAGARVLGDVRIGRGVVIGANAVVTRDIPAGATVVGANRILSSERPSPMGSGRMHTGSAVARFPLDASRSLRSRPR